MLEPFARSDLALTTALYAGARVRVSHSAVWGTRVTPRTAARGAFTDKAHLRGSVGERSRAGLQGAFMFFQNTSAGYACGECRPSPESSAT